MITRLTRRLTRAQQATTLLAITVVCHLSAAGASAAPLMDLESKIGDLVDQLTTYGRLLAGLAFVIVFLSWICEPALPSWARENKGIFARIIVGCVGLGLAPDIVAFVFGA